MNNWFNIIQHKLFPPICILCDGAGFDFKDICPGCYAELRLNSHCCPQCAQPVATKLSSGLVCGHCLKKPPPYHRVIAPFLYQHSVQWLITGLKFHRQYKNARLLAQLFLDRFSGFTPLPDCLVPMPLHPKRLRQRGFNQTEEIASIIAKQLRIPLRPDLCRRVKFSAPQSELDARARQQNIRNAFEALPLSDHPHIALFDDVMTTGATVSELSKTFKKAGARQVDVWVCARAPGGYR